MQDKTNVQDLIKYLRGIVEDHSEQGVHFEFGENDAIAIQKAADMLEQMVK